MKKIELAESVTFWPERITPYRVTMQEGEEVFLLDKHGDFSLVSLSDYPTRGDARWVKNLKIKEQS